MYRLLIVDDEHFIRQGLKDFVDWNSLGFSVIGDAPDGRKAFDIITEMKPDVVLTDIKMPFCDGIQLMHKIRENELDISIVVLSGYEEFEFARAAVEAGATGYLLKPIKMDQLKDIMHKIKKKIDLKIQDNLKKDMAAKIIKEDFIYNLACGTIQNTEQIQKQFVELELQTSCLNYSIWIIDLDKSHGKSSETAEEKDSESSFISTVKKMAEELLSSYGFVYTFGINTKSIGVLLCGNLFSDTGLVESAEKIKSQLCNFFDISTTIVISEIFHTMQDLSEFYNKALSDLEKKFFLGGNRIITSNNQNFKTVIASGNKVNTEKVLTMLQNMDIDSIISDIDEKFLNAGSKGEVCDRFFVYIKILTKFLERNGTDLTDIIPGTEFELNKIANEETVINITAILKDIYRRVVAFLKDKNWRNIYHLVTDAMKYIELHYNRNISLETTADEIHLHPMYLSRIFKKETGKSFTDYLIEVRMRKAKELLGDYSLKTYDISRLIGYHSPKHFSRLFKEFTGVTPKEYRKNLLGYEDTAEK